MGFIPVQPRQTREMRERYRKLRRRQQAQGLLLGCALFLLLAGSLLIWRKLTVRPPTDSALTGNNPAATRPAAPPPQREKLPAAPGIKVVTEKSFDPAPWLLETDGEQLFSLTDHKPFAEPGPYYVADAITAGAIRGKQLWEQRGEFKASMVDVAEGRLITLQESPSDKTVLVTAYDIASGKQAWQQEVKDVARATLLAVGKEVLVSYSAAGGPRITCFSSESGTKVWGLKPPLRGANRSLADTAGGPALRLQESEGSVIYTHANVIGFASRQSGKLLRNEFAASGRLAVPAIEEQRNRVFVQVQGNQQGSSSIMAIPLDGSEAWLAARVLAADDELLFIPGPDWLLCAFRKMDNKTPRMVIECKPLDKESGAIAFKHELAGGSAACGGLIPGSNSFLLGVAAEAADPQSMAGARQFYVVSPASASLEVAGRTPQPAFAMLSFRNNLIALCDGGLLARFDPGSLGFKTLKKLRYPQFGLRQSDDHKTLLIWSSTEGYFEDQPLAGEPLQAVVIR